MRTLLLAALAACGTTPMQGAAPQRPVDVATSAGPAVGCGDTVLQDQTTSGGERLVSSVPCFDIHEEETVRRADIPAAAPTHDREIAGAIVETELHSCAGISEAERQHSPFAHKREIAQVEPYIEGHVVRGVRITFKPVTGLTAKWMQQDIQCHQARFAALGQPATYLPGDPSLVPGARVSVVQRGRAIEVLIDTPDVDGAHLALQRARDLTAPAAAVR